MIKRTTCSFLGLKDDPTTALNFPSEGNFCHHARPVAPVKGNYQQQYCLSSEHTACPIYQAQQLRPLPVALTAPSYANASPRRLLATIGIPILLAGTTALALSWNAIGDWISKTNSMAVADAGLPGAWSLLVTKTQNIPTDPPTTVPSAKPVVTDCPLPNGWVPYLVNPTDSLYRLSVIYGVSVEQLQQANCLENQTIIKPGQVIYVPNIPTDTALPTAIPLRALPTSTPKPPQKEQAPANTPVPPQPAVVPIVNTPVSEKPKPPADTSVKPSNKTVDNPKPKPVDNGGKNKGKVKNKKGKGK